MSRARGRSVTPSWWLFKSSLPLEASRGWKTTPKSLGGRLRRFSFCLRFALPEVYCLLWHPDGAQLVAGSTDGVARVFETQKGLCLVPSAAPERSKQCRGSESCGGGSWIHGTSGIEA